MTIDTTEAIRLAAEAITSIDSEVARTLQHVIDEAAYQAVTAALPALAEQFAQAVEAWASTSSYHDASEVTEAYLDAARLIREVAT